jgi:hypothetical protein
LARRKGKDWYVAGISGESGPREVALPLSFLDGYVHTQSLIMDGANKSSLAERSGDVTPADTMKVSLLPYGGFAAFLKQSTVASALPPGTGSRTEAKGRGKGAEFDANGRRLPGTTGARRSPRPVKTLSK